MKYGAGMPAARLEAPLNELAMLGRVVWHCAAMPPLVAEQTRGNNVSPNALSAVAHRGKVLCGTAKSSCLSGRNAIGPRELVR